MRSRESGLGGHINLFVCDQCHAELRQVLDRPPEPEPDAKAPVSEVGCPDCLEADLNCFSCDDPICDKHTRTVEKYAHVFSPDLGEKLVATHGNRLYCPLCFKNVINRFSNEVRTAPSIAKPRIFNFPVIIGLLIVMLIIMIGVQRCSPDFSRQDKETTIGQPAQ